MSANALHKHIKAEECYFVLDGAGRIRIGDETITVPRYGGVLVAPEQTRQVFNDTEPKVPWLIVSAPDAELEEGHKMDMSLFWPVDPTQRPTELSGVVRPPRTDA